MVWNQAILIYWAKLVTIINQLKHNENTYAKLNFNNEIISLGCNQHTTVATEEISGCNWEQWFN